MSKFKVIYDPDFKRQDTTYVMRVQLFDDANKVIIPNTSHTWGAKVVKGVRRAGKEYSVSLSGDTINVPAKQFADLPTGNYGLELWETNGGNTTIYPSAGFIPFRIHRNADDSLTQIDPTVDINQLIADLHKAGLNVVFDKVEMLAENAKAQAISEIRDGKNHITLKIPRGLRGYKGDQGDRGPKGADGATWQPYISKDGHWHIKKVTGETGLTEVDEAKFKQYVDDAILNGKW